MSEVEGLVREFAKFVRLPWDASLAGAQKVWFAIYEPSHERRVRLRLEEFAIATRAAGHGWQLIDLSDTFAHWMAQHEYREAYFEQPEDMELALEDFEDAVVVRLQEALTAPEIDNNAIVAVVGVASLFGLVRASAVLDRVTQAIQGRLLVFFPGHHEGSNYRLLDARDGWNYLAIPITAREER
jgi:hypothetical protein